MRAARRLSLRRETLTELTAAHLLAVAGGSVGCRTAHECRTFLSLDDACAPTTSIAALQCVRTVRDGSCAC